MDLFNKDKDEKASVATPKEKTGVIAPFEPGKMQLSGDVKDLFASQVTKSMENVTARLPQIKISRETGQYIFPEDDLRKDFVGIIIDSNLTKAYWENPFNGESNPPTCASLNAIEPTQFEGDEPVCKSCGSCPKNKWGSGHDKDGNKTKGKACRDLRRVHVLIEGSLIPFRLTLPPTSLSNYDDYVTSLAGNNMPLIAVVSRFFTEKGESGGFSISKFKAEKIGYIAETQEDFEKEFMSLVKKQNDFQTAMRGEKIEADEYETVNNENSDLDPEMEVSQEPKKDCPF